MSQKFCSAETTKKFAAGAQRKRLKKLSVTGPSYCLVERWTAQFDVGKMRRIR